MSFTVYAEPKNPLKAPDMAFFEYLADMVEVDGELVGPLDLKSSSATVLPNTSSSKVKLKLDKNDTLKTDIKNSKTNTFEDKNNG
jgi:hypothetical protein